MSNFNFIKSGEKKRIVQELEQTYGISELNYLLLETGKRKIRGFSGHLSKEEILKMADFLNVELIGMYLLNKRDGDARLNFDAVSLLRNGITKNRVKITKKQLDFWIRGQDLEIPGFNGLVAIEYDGELIGVGKSNGTKIFNYVPKERKLKTPLP